MFEQHKLHFSCAAAHVAQILSIHSWISGHSWKQKLFLIVDYFKIVISTSSCFYKFNWAAHFCFLHA